MIDWGISATIMVIVTFIVTQVNENKIKKLNGRLAKNEKELSALYNELAKVGAADDDGSA